MAEVQSRESGAPAKDGDDREIDLKEYLGILADGWRWLAVCAALGAFVAAYMAWSQAPSYQASALMQVEKNQSMQSQVFMPGPGGAGGGAESGVTIAETAIIKSRSVIGMAVDQEHLEVSATPEYLPVIGEPVARLHSAYLSGLWGLSLFGKRYAWGNEHVRVTRMALPEGMASAQFVLVAQEGGHYKLLHGDSEHAVKGTVGKTVSGAFPGLGDIKIFVQELTAAPGTRFTVRSVTRDAAIASLQKRLTVEEQPKGSGILGLSLTASSPKAAEHQLNAIMNAYLEQNVQQQSKEAKKRLAFLKKQLPEIREERNQAQAKLAQYQSKTGTLDLSSQANAILQQLTNLDQKLGELSIERQQLLQEYTSKAPQVKAINDKRAALQGRRNKLQQQLKKLPKSESKFLELRRNVEVNDQLYTQLLNRSQGLQISKAGITGITHIVDKAYSNGHMIAPKRLLMLVVGLLVGLIIGVAVVLIRAIFRSTVDEPNEIESRFGLAVYSTVPFSGVESNRTKRSSRLLAVDKPDDPAIESLRSFRTSLQFARIEGPSKCIAITGPTPGCGKSFVSANLGVLIASSGARVLLIDGDLRRGRLHRQFAIDKQGGFSDVLAGEKAMRDAITPTGIDNLDVVTSGKQPPNPAELLLSVDFEALKQELAEQYDYILFDLPPVLNVTDANIVASNVAATFMVVRSEHSTRHEIDQAIRRTQKDGIQISGVIFNGLRTDRLRYGFRKYQYYSYEYS